MDQNAQTPWYRKLGAPDRNSECLVDIGVKSVISWLWHPCHVRADHRDKSHLSLTDCTIPMDDEAKNVGVLGNTDHTACSYIYGDRNKQSDRDTKNRVIIPRGVVVYSHGAGLLGQSTA